MTPDLRALAAHLVTLPGWRWIPGCPIAWPDCGGDEDDEGEPNYHLRIAVGSPIGAMDAALSPYDGLDVFPIDDDDAVPDLSHPAALGCLLALVREAWKDDGLTLVCETRNDGRFWHISHARFFARATRTDPTEAHALVAALEAAPAGGDEP